MRCSKHQWKTIMTPKKQVYTEIVSNNTLISWKSILLRHTVESLFVTDSRAQNK